MNIQNNYTTTCSIENRKINGVHQPAVIKRIKINRGAGNPKHYVPTPNLRPTAAQVIKVPKPAPQADLAKPQPIQAKPQPVQAKPQPAPAIPQAAPTIPQAVPAPEVEQISRVQPLKDIYDYIAEETMDLVNEYRRDQGLPNLAFSPEIYQIAKLHAQQMAKGTAPFSHEGYIDRAHEIRDHINAHEVGENLAMNTGFKNPVEEAVKGWLESPAHHENMLRDYTQTAVGLAQSANGTYYFTQLFAK